MTVYKYCIRTLIICNCWIEIEEQPVEDYWLLGWNWGPVNLPSALHHTVLSFECNFLFVWLKMKSSCLFLDLQYPNLVVASCIIQYNHMFILFCLFSDTFMYCGSAFVWFGSDCFDLFFNSVHAYFILHTFIHSYFIKNIQLCALHCSG